MASAQWFVSRFRRLTLHEVYSVLNARWRLRAVDRLPMTVRLRGRAVVRNAGTIEFGERVQLAAAAGDQEFVCGPGATLKVESGTFINQGTIVRASESVTIGSDCRIGTYCL